MKKVIDARGLPCPQPVVLTKKGLEESDQLTTIVDNNVAVENVTKLAKSKGCTVQVEEKDDAYYLHISKSCTACQDVSENQGSVAVLITSSFFGDGDEALGKTLMKSFLYALNQVENISHLVFMNSGVFLTTEGSEVLDLLKAAEENGVEVLSCGTCLDFYKLKDQLAVGKVTNMYTAVDVVTSAAKTITL
ncbi:MAG: sulfurtransferase-like selenium metabolism protein YedF [Syntrophaceticus sp.]